MNCLSSVTHNAKCGGVAKTMYRIGKELKPETSATL